MNYLTNRVPHLPMFHGGRVTNSLLSNHPMGYYADGGAPYIDAGTGANGRADNIPARLSEKEYVLDAETVSLLGDGNPDEGARKLDEMRAALRRHKGQYMSRGELSPPAMNPLDYCGGGYSSAMGRR